MDTLGYVSSSLEMVPRSPRQLVRHVAVSVFAASSAATGATARALCRPRVQILNLHHVFPDEEHGFLQLLTDLKREHTFLDYSDAVARIQRGGIDRPYVAFTMDDGMKSCVRAADILEQFGVRACFFLVTSMVGERDLPRIREFCRRRILVPPFEFLTWDDAEVLRARGHEFGSHTVSHLRLSDLEPSRVSEEVHVSAQLLRARLGEARHFAWPYGGFADANAAIVAQVFAAGYRSCASAVRGCHVAGGSPLEPTQLCIRRDHCLARWPSAHCLYFMQRNADSASPAGNDWPDSWTRPDAA